MMRNVFIIRFALLFFVSANAQQFSFRNYSVKEGVAQSQVYSLLQDSRGFLWMGTRGGGITRYDGLNFKTFTVRDGLVNNYVFDLKEGPDGRLWIGTNNGLSIYNGVRFTNYVPTGDSSQVWVQQIAFDKKGRAWLATNYGVLMFDSTLRFTNISRKVGQRRAVINAIYVDADGSVWFGNANGLFRIHQINGNFDVEKYNPAKGYLNNSITAIKKDAYGNLWLGTYADGLYLLKKGSFYKLDPTGELAGQTILDIYFDDAGNAWLATLLRGVGQYNLLGRSITWLGENEGLSNNHVRSILQDKSGNFWFGTSGGGVCNYFGKQFTHYDKTMGLAGNFIYSVFKDSRQRLWVGTSDKGLTVLDSGRFYNFGAENGFAGVKVKSMAEDNAGILYFGTDGQGIYQYDGVEFKQVEEFNRRYIRAMQKDNMGRVWIATAGAGLYIFTPGAEGPPRLKHLTTANGLLHDRLTSLHHDRQGRMWYGTENDGVACIQNDSVHVVRYNTKNGLSSNTVRCLSEDGKGRLWIGTAGYGVCSVKLYEVASQVNCLDHTNGLTSSNVYLLTADARNNLFVGTETGLDYLQLDEDGRVNDIKHYSKGEGFTGIETCQNAVFKEVTGSIWFGTINGLSKYNPANHVRNQHPPITTITDIKLFYESIANTAYRGHVGDWNTISALELPHNQNRLTFDFMAINFSNPDAVKYQWKLEGFDKDWSPVSKDRSISYSNLGAGHYTFNLKACNEDGVWNSKPVRFSFVILPPFWLSWWFIGGALLAVTGIIWGFFRWRINRVKARAKAQQDKLQMEKELLELEQKALRLQMNPHFIFNALNSIQSQIGTDNEQSARYYLAKFSRLMRQILDNSRNTLISLDEEVSTLENYLLIEKFCNGNKFDYTITVDDSLERDFVKLPPMLLQPFIENSIKHGVKHNTGQQGLIEVRFEEKGGMLECSVKDNGIGRKQSEAINKASRDPSHKSAALDVTRERLDLFVNTGTTGTMEIIDLFNEAGQAAGTQVLLRLPLN